MFYRKRMNKKPNNLIKLNYSTFSKGINSDIDPNIMSVRSATASYNFFYKSGALTHGYGFDLLQVPVGNTSAVQGLEYPAGNISFEGAWVFKFYNTTYNTFQNKVVLYGSDKNLYWFCATPSLDNFVHQMIVSSFTTCPNAVNYRLNDQDVIIFTSPTDGMTVWNSNQAPYAVTTAPNITSMCVHYERLFATVDGEKNAVWFSQDLDPTNWAINGTGAGFIEMLDERGCLNKVISFLDYVYIFRDYGITRLTAYADESEFSVAHLFSSSGKIYSETVSICGDVVMMLTDNGIYSFNGISTNKLDINIDNMLKGIDNSMAKGCYYNGKYYLALRLNYEDDAILEENRAGGCVNNSLLAIDVQNGSFTLSRGMDISYLCPILTNEQSKLIFCLRGSESTKLAQLSESGKYFGTNLPKAWYSPKNDLGYPNKTKVIRDIYISTKYACRVDVRTEKTTKSYTVTAGENRLRVNIRANTLAIDFHSDNDLAYISPPKVYLGLV